MKRAVVIGGGGAFGAITVGKLAKQDKHYDYVLGVSTGAIMSLLVASKSQDKWARLKEAYTTVNNKEVYNVYPFTKNGNLKIMKTIFRSILGDISVGEMRPIVNLIKKWVSETEFKSIQESGTQVIVAVLNVTTGRVEYHNARDYDYDQYCEYIAAASCPEIVGNLWQINGWEYSDSGLATLVPIVKATKLDVSEIDVFVHRPFIREFKNSQRLDMSIHWLPKMMLYSMRIIKAIHRYVLIQRENLEYKEQREGVLRALIKGQKITCFYLDSVFKKHNAMVMDKAVMTRMYEHGYKTMGETDIRMQYNMNNWEQLFDQQDDE